MVYTANYYRIHNEAGLTYSGRDAEGEEEWIGDKRQWKALETLEELEQLSINLNKK